MKYGYVRAKNEEFKNVQLNFLQDKAEQIIIETDGKQLGNLLEVLQPNDSLYVYDMDRLTRKIDTAKEIIKTLLDKNVQVHTSNEGKIMLKCVGYSLSIISDIDETEDNYVAKKCVQKFNTIQE